MPQAKTEISENQYKYLNSLIGGKNPDGSAASQGNMAWAKNQLANSIYKPKTPVTTTSNKTPEFSGGFKGGAGSITNAAINAAATALKTPQAGPNTSTASNWNARTNDLYGRIEQALATPFKPQEFNYTVDNGPVYKSALSRAQANATTASGNAMAELNRRGILNSTITGDRVAQIEQAELGRVSDEIVPQLYAQAYQRHRDSVNDQYTNQRNTIADLRDMLGLSSDLDQREKDNIQRGLDNDQRAWENRFAYGEATGMFNNGQKTLARQQLERGIFENDRGYDREVFESDRNFDRDVLESDRGYKRDILESDRSYNLDRSRENRIASGGGSGGSGNAKPANLNTIIDNINSQYLIKDDVVGTGRVSNPIALEQYILSLRLPDDQTEQLYRYYNIPL